MRAEGARDEAEATDEQDQHDESVEQAGGTKVDAHVGEDAREDKQGAHDGKKPASFAATVPE